MVVFLVLLVMAFGAFGYFKDVNEEMSDEDLMQYAKECFLDDIYSFVSSDELMDVIHAEIIND